ncbi:MAG: hypothetical protein PHY46_05230 [Candidatus Omnitrophica bacterium]|nr:hypothetical protein [Candidatus Omnitrophota bacterium]
MSELENVIKKARENPKMPTLEEMYKIIQTKGSSGIEEIENKDIQAIALAVRNYYAAKVSEERINNIICSCSCALKKGGKECRLNYRSTCESKKQAAKSIAEMVK